MSKVVMISIGVGLAFILVIGSVLIGMYNDAASLQNTYQAKISANKAEFDNLKKKISQVTQVTEMQMAKLEQLFARYAEARTSESDNLLMNWVQETVPNVDQNTFVTLQNLIIGSRNAWTMRQTELVDIARQFNERLVTFPSNLVLKLFGFSKLDPKIITSTSTEKAFETGKDDNTDLK